MVQFKRNLLSVALASATMMLAAGAHAQTVDEQAQQGQAKSDAKTLDTVVVTGIRRGIENAIETKQANSSIVEAISAEDVGKLPDTSIADSIARLPGLTAQRFGGRPQEINIRGFSGDFSTTTLNGREQVSLGNNRGVEFDQYPSELMNQVVVYKTQDASLIGQGLSGTVDLQTVSPLSFADRTIAVNVRGDMNRLNGNDEHGSRFSLSYIDQFADRTVGLALGYARLNNPVQGTQFEAWGYDNGVLSGGKLYQSDMDNTRDGFMGVLEFRPNDMYTTRLDVFYSKFDKEEVKRGMEFGLGTGKLVSRTDDASGFATQASFANFDPVIRNDYNAAKDDLFSIGWNHKLKLNENWTLTADISSSSAKREERVLETYAGLATGVAGDNVSITYDNDGFFDFDFGYDYTDPSILRLTDAGGWGQDGYIKDFTVEDDLTSFRLDLERSFDSGALSSLKFGANITDRTKSRASDEHFLCLQADCARGVELPMPGNLATTSSFSFAGLPGLYGYDALAAFNSIYSTRANLNNGDINNKNWEVKERVGTFYVQGNLDFNIGSVPIRGNVGVQAVNVEQESTGVSTFQNLTLDEPHRSGVNYTDYLPSLNLKAEFAHDQFLRFGAGRQIARPRMDQMRGNVNYSVNLHNGETNCPPGYAQTSPTGQPNCPIFEGSGGNPELRPWKADAFDLSYEKYFAHKGYVSAGYFYKDLKTYVRNEATVVDFSQLPIGTIVGQVPNSPVGVFTQPVNGEGGTLKGFEVAASIPLDMFWAPLEGFGVQANYSQVDSSIEPTPGNPLDTLPGLSKYVSNATVYYERFGFSARVSQRSRSQFRGEVEGFGGDRTIKLFQGETVTDLQLGYAFQSGPLENLSFLLQVNNIENEPFKSQFPNDGRAREFFEYGRTYLFGVNYKF